jgi:isopentenyldiphosphate isomerase
MIHVATLWIINERGELLMAQRAHNKSTDPSTWGPSVTGKLEPGESFDEALVREVHEELSLPPHEYTPQFAVQKEFVHPDGETRTFGVYYAFLTKDKTALITIDTKEVAAIQWHSLEDIETMMRNTPELLVPSANAVWPDEFEAFKAAKAL